MKAIYHNNMRVTGMYLFGFWIMVFVLFINPNTFSQSNYPKILVNGTGDTLVIQTLEQTRWVSMQLEIGKSCELSGMVKDSIINKQAMNEKYFNRVISIKNEIIASKDSTIADKGLIIDSYNTINVGLVKENKSLKLKNNLILIGSGVIITLITILSIF